MRRIGFGLTLLSAVLLSGCISSQNPSNGAIRVVNAVPDAPRMNVLLNDALRATQLDFSATSAYFATVAGSYDVRIEEILPGSGANFAVFDEPVNLAVNDELSLIVVGNAEGHNEEVVPVLTRTRGVPSGNARIQFVHAAVGGPSLDAYITAPDAVIDCSTPRFTSVPLAYKDFTAQQDMPNGTVKIVLTSPCPSPTDPAAVLFESGDIFLGLEQTLLIAIVPNTGLDAATRPFALVLAGDVVSGVAFDKNTESNLRLVNVSPDSYPLDTLLKDPSDDSVVVQRTNLPFGGIDGYFTVVPATYAVEVQKTGDPATVPLEFTQSYAGGTNVSLMFTNLIAQLGRAIVFDNPRRIATEAKLRLIHGSPGAGTLDFYITDPAPVLANETADFSGALLGANTGYVSLPAGTQQVTFIVTGSKADADIRATQQVTLENGGIYTMVLTDKPAGGLPAQVLSIDDPLQ